VSGVFDGATPEQGMQRAMKRVKMVSDGDLEAWMDVALPGLMRQWDDFKRSREVAHLGEMIIAETTLAAALPEMYDRYQARIQEGLEG
jgi:hypothetical protein